MSFRLVDAGWNRELQAAVRANPTRVRLVSPFIKQGALASAVLEGPDDELRRRNAGAAG